MLHLLTKMLILNSRSSVTSTILIVTYARGLFAAAYRLDLAKASRAWRKGVPTAFIMDQELHLLQNASAVQVSCKSCLPLCSWQFTVTLFAEHLVDVQEDLTENLEFWASSPDVAPTNPLTEKAGDFR